MIWPLSTIRQLEDRCSSLQSVLEGEIQSRISVERELEAATSSLLVEQSRRISAEAIASERQSEIERLLTGNRELREDLRSVTSERIKSVDNINLKLMEAKIPELPVDFAKHHSAAQKPMAQLVNNTRQKTREIDMAVLAQARLGFPKRHMNQTIPGVGVVPTLAEIEKADIAPAPAAPPVEDVA